MTRMKAFLALQLSSGLSVSVRKQTIEEVLRAIDRVVTSGHLSLNQSEGGGRSDVQRCSSMANPHHCGVADGDGWRLWLHFRHRLPETKWPSRSRVHGQYASGNHAQPTRGHLRQRLLVRGLPVALRLFKRLPLKKSVLIRVH